MCCEFFDDSNYLLIGLHSGATLLLDKSGNAIWGHYAKNVITSNSISARREYVAVGSEDNFVYFFNYEGKLLWKYGTGAAVSSVKVSKNGDFIIVGSHDDFIYFFNKNGELLWNFRLNSWVNTVNLSQNGFYVVAGSQNKRLYFLNRNSELLWKYETHYPIKIVKISVDGEHVLVCSGNFLEFFDKHGRRLWKYEISDRIESASFSKNGKSFIVGSRNKNFYYFNEKGELLWSYSTGGIIHTVDISSNGDIVVAGSNDCYAYLFNLQDFFKSFVTKAEKVLIHARDFGCDIKEAEVLLKKSKNLMEQEKYEDAMNFAIRASSNALKVQKLSRPEIHIDITKSDNLKVGEWDYLTINLENKGTAHAKKISLRISGPMKIKNLDRNFDLKVREKKELKPTIKPTIKISHFILRINGIYYDANKREYSFQSSTDVKLEGEEREVKHAFDEESGEVSYFKYKYITKKVELKICPFCTARFRKDLAVDQDGKLKCPKCGAHLI